MITCKYLPMLSLAFLVLLLLRGSEPWPDAKDNKDYYQKCDEGYVGPNCLIPTPTCQENKPCFNRETCVTGDYNYSCICKEGFNNLGCSSDNICRYSAACDLLSDLQTCTTCQTDVMEDSECKYESETFLIVAAENEDIRLISLDGKTIRKIAILNDDKVVSMAYSYETNTLFWSSQNEQKINADRINEEEIGGYVFQNDNNQEQISKLAVNWIYNHLYYVAGRQLVMSNFDGTLKKVIFNDFNGTELSLDPFSTRLFWTLPNGQRVEADLDGKSIHDFISRTETDALSGLVPDFAEYQSNDATVGQPFDKYIYRANAETTIYKINQCDDKETTPIYKCECENITHILIFNAAQQPGGTNLCLNQDKQCSNNFCIPIRSPDHGSLSTICARLN